jgi:hypothetical protein
MDALVLRCLAKEPADRPVDMATLAVELRAIAADLPQASLVRPPSHVHTPSTSSAVSAMVGQLVDEGRSRAPSRRTGLGVVAVVLALAGGGWLWSRVTTSPQSASMASGTTANAAPISDAPANRAPSAGVPAPITPATAPLRVVVRSEPAGATVLVDGQARGTTPAVLELKLPQELHFALDGYLPEKAVVTAVEGPPFKLTPVPKKASSHHAGSSQRNHASGHELGGGVD